MELHPTPFPVRSQYMKPKPAKKISDPPKPNSKDGSLLLREKRVFGTAWNSNITTKPIKGKPSSVRLKKDTKPPPSTTQPPIAEAKSSSGKIPVMPKKKKSVCFQETDVEVSGKIADGGNSTEPQTPVRTPAVQAKTRVATPYHSAERCSKCRFDKLETSAYWLSQIKLAESVGKHSVSAAFFGLALECKAEPIHNVRIEVKKYLSRHENLSAEEEWKKLSVGYGLMKDKRRVDTNENEVEENDRNDKDLMNKIAQDYKSSQ